MNTQSLRFESISEIPRWIDNHPQVTSGRDSTSTESDESWDLNTDLDAAMGMARAGGRWDEGAKMIRKTSLAMASLKRTGRVHSLDTDVAGFLPDVPAFLAGDPCAMWADGETDGDQAPILTVGIGVRSPGSFKSYQKINYGAAILSALDELEDGGARTEVWACYANRSGKLATDFRVLIKAAEDTWSPSSVAFALAHPAYHRRLMFRLAEGIRELDVFTGGYGIGYNLYDEFDLWLPALKNSDSWSEDAEQSLKRATRRVQEQLDDYNPEEKAA